MNCIVFAGLFLPSGTLVDRRPHVKPRKSIDFSAKRGAPCILQSSPTPFSSSSSLLNRWRYDDADSRDHCGRPVPARGTNSVSVGAGDCSADASSCTVCARSDCISRAPSDAATMPVGGGVGDSPAVLAVRTNSPARRQTCGSTGGAVTTCAAPEEPDIDASLLRYARVSAGSGRSRDRY